MTKKRRDPTEIQTNKSRESAPTLEFRSMRVLLLLLLPLVHSTVSPYATTCSSISSAAFAKHKGALAECNRVCDAGGDVEGFGQLAET